MIFKRLIINNIASIKDADIDFCSDPLNGDNIFLICGETGSGKTTILDAICLALYDDAPRLDSVPDKNAAVVDGLVVDENGQLSPKANSLTLKDSRQLLRRGAAEGSVELFFTGNDGADYSVKWEAYRSYKKVTGRIQEVQRTLRCPSGEVITGKNNVAEKIQEIIGLTFGQFCRTSMLAQGQFSKFLQSSDDDKAGILEKLTDTSVYSRIGVAIYNKAQEAEKAFKDQDVKLTGIRLLSQEETDDFNAELDGLSSEKANLAGTLNGANAKKVWFEEIDKRTAKVESAKHDFETALDVTASQEHKDAQALCADWEATAILRRLARDISKERQELDAIASNLDACRSEFCSLEAVRMAEIGDTGSLSEQLKAKENKLDSMKPYAAVLDSWPQVSIYLDSYRNALVSKADAQKKKAEAESDVIGHSNKKDEAEAKVSEEKKQSELFDRQVAELKKKINEADKPAKSKLRTLLESVKSAAQIAKSAAEVHSAAIIALGEAEGKLTGSEKALAAAQAEAEKMRTLLKTAEDDYAKADKDYEAAKDSVDKFARELRSRLHQGDKCPVCGQTVAEVVPDEVFEGLFAPVKSKREESRKAKDAAMQTAAVADSKVKVLTDAVVAETKALSQARENCELTGRKLEDGLSGLSDAFKTAGRSTDISFDSALGTSVEGIDSIVKDLEETIKGADEEISLLGREISAIEADEMQLNEVVQKYTASLNKVNELNTQLANAEANRTAALARVKALTDNIAAFEKTSSENLSKIGEYFALTPAAGTWQDSLLGDFESFILKWKNAAGGYKSCVKEIEALGAEIDLRNSVLSGINDIRNEILSNRPEWSEIQVQYPAVQTRRAPVEKSQWSNLSSKVIGFISGRDQVNKNLSQHNEELEAGIAKGNISRERLAQLCGVSEPEIAELRKRVDGAEEKRRSKETEYNLTKALLEEEISKKSSLGISDSENFDAVKNEIAELSLKLENVQSRIAQINQSLITDVENRKKFESESAKRDELESAMQRWKGLSECFGSSNGKTFRMLAQSFVLADLIDKANFYLKHLSGRYELDNPIGTMIITVRDMNQGGAERPANTLSGGETFLVSLALALGLSNLNNNGLKIGTLFIDEGFGTLSPEYLNTVMETLDNLYQIGGKKVGVISHVEALRERIPVQIQVSKGNSASTVRVVRSIQAAM